MKRLLFLIFLSAWCNIYSQKCECKDFVEIEKTINESISKGNYSRAEKEINTLVESDKIVCKLYGLNELFASYDAQRRFDLMPALLKQFEQLIPKVECDIKRWYSKFCFNTAVFYYRISNYSKSVEYCYQSISAAEGLNDVDLLLKTKQLLVQTLSYMNRDEEAALIVTQNYGLIMNSEDSYEKADHIVWLIKHYDVFYNTTGDPAYIDTMKFLCNEGRLVAKKFNNKDALVENYLSTDILYYYAEDYNIGLRYLDSALLIVNYLTDGKELARIHLSKAWDYISIGNRERAYFEHDSAMYYFKNFYQPYEVSAGYTDGAEIYSIAGDFKTAYKYYQRGIEIRDSITSITTSNKIAELEQKYNKQVNERRIVDLQQENEISKQKQFVSNLRLRLLGGTIILILLLIIIGVFIIRQRMLKQKNESLKMEMRLNRSRMNPHFFFNALTSLQNLSLDPLNADEVSIQLGRYSKIMRLTLESTYHELISLNEEIEFTEKYIQLQQMRFVGKFDYKIEIDEELDGDVIGVPAMILQPFVENSIEHGFHNINYLGLITISARMANNHIMITILDNGSKSEKESTHIGYPSRALQIINDRLRLLNKKYRSEAKFEITERKDTSGYQIVLTLPYIKII